MNSLKTQVVQHMKIIEEGKKNMEIHSKLQSQIYEVEKKLTKMNDNNCKLQKDNDELKRIKDKFENALDEITNIKQYKSINEFYEGSIKYFEDQDDLEDEMYYSTYRLYIKYYHTIDNIFENYILYGSWDNYQTSYKLYQLLDDNSSVFYIKLYEKLLYGKYTYKFKKNDKWIEPSEDELREKDTDGNYNNILFVHT